MVAKAEEGVGNRTRDPLGVIECVWWTLSMWLSPLSVVILRIRRSIASLLWTQRENCLHLPPLLLNVRHTQSSNNIRDSSNLHVIYIFFHHPCTHVSVNVCSRVQRWSRWVPASPQTLVWLDSSFKLFMVSKCLKQLGEKAKNHSLHILLDVVLICHSCLVHVSKQQHPTFCWKRLFWVIFLIYRIVYEPFLLLFLCFGINHNFRKRLCLHMMFSIVLCGLYSYWNFLCPLAEESSMKKWLFKWNNCIKCVDK